MSIKKRKDQPTKNNTSKIYLYLLILLCVGFFFTKILFWNQYPVWDEAVYLGMGKYMYSAGQSGLWEMIRPLGLPMITGLWWAVGLDQVMMSRIIATLFSLGIIIMIYVLCKKLFDEKVALISACIIAITPIFFSYADYILTDHVSPLAILVALYFMIENRYILAGIFAGIAFWFKFTHILFVGVLGIYLIYKFWMNNKDSISNKKKSSNKNTKTKEYHSYGIPKEIIALLIMFAIIGLYFFCNAILYHQHLGIKDAIVRPYLDAAGYANNPYQNLSFTNFKEFVYYMFYYLYNITLHSAYGNILFIFALVYIMRLKIFLQDEKHVLLFIAFLVYLIYFSIIPYKNERFCISILPFLAIYAGYGILWCYAVLKNRAKTKVNTAKKRLGKTLVICFIIIVLSMGACAISKEYDSHQQRVQLKESIVHNIEIENYFDRNNISGPILTDDPQFVVYSNERYIPAYDVLNKKGLFLNDWESTMVFNAAVYNDQTVPCFEEDKVCMANKQKLMNILESNFTARDSYIYHGANITFYVRK